MIPITFAPSVPDDIREWATEQTAHSFGRTKIQEEVGDRIRRLVSYGTTKSLWNPLLKLRAHNSTLDLMSILQTAVTAPSEFQRLSREPIRLVKEDADSLAKDSRRMALELKRLMEKVSLPNRHALSLYRVAMAAAEHSVNPLQKVLLLDPMLQSELLDFERYAPDLPALVAAMATTLKDVVRDEARLRPRKMQATNADRTFVIVTLKRYFLKAIGRVPSSIVAKIVNLTLDRTDTTTGTVSKARY